MKKKYLFLLMICISALAFVCCHQGNTDTVSSENEHCKSIQNDKSYIKDCERINSYVYGIDMKAKRKLVLSNAAMHFIEEASCPVDSTLPVVYVQYVEDYKGYDVYCIGDAISTIFDYTCKITSIEYTGPYVIAYGIKGEEPLSNETILSKGFNDRAYMIHVNEVSWFVLMDPHSTRHIVVKNAWTEQDCYKHFDNFLNSDNKFSIEEVVEPVTMPLQ